MNFHLDLSNYKYLFSFMAIIVVLISSGHSRRSRYILPILPETHYTLNDVIILPENRDVVDLTITSIETSKELASLILTVEHEFRLGYAETLQNISLDSGLKLITSSKTNAILDIPGGLLKLPPISDYGKIYNVLALPDNTGRDIDTVLVIQSEVPDTSMKVCGINTEDEIMTQNLKDTSKGDISIKNCSTLITSRTGRYLLNNTLGFQTIKITSEHPISILQGYAISLSSNSNKNKQNISYPLASRIYWKALPALSKSTSTIIVAPSHNRRDYTFWIVSPNNSVVDFQTNNSSRNIHLTSNKPFHKNVIIPAGNVLTVTGQDEYSLHCVKPDNSTCNAELFSAAKGSINYNSSSNTDSISNEYMWIYISNNTIPFILAPHSTSFSIMYSDGQISKERTTDFNICNSSLILKSFANFPEGLYKISVNQGFNFELFFYLPKHNVCECDTTKYFKRIQFNTTLSSITPKKLSGKSTALPLFLSTNNTSDYFTKLQDRKTMPHTRFSKVTTRTKNASIVPVNEDFSNSTVETATSTFVERKESLIQYEHSTQKSNTFSDKIKKDETTENKQTTGNDPNRMFNAIVDIVHSAEGRKDILINKSNNKGDSKYAYTYNVNNDYGLEHRGKNPVAIIASLVSAILAVGAIILIFLLKDFFSQRQNIRKTRIRPFVSYY